MMSTETYANYPLIRDESLLVEFQWDKYLSKSNI